MAHKIKIKSSNRGNGMYRYNKDVWNILLDLDNGLLQADGNKIYLRTISDKFLTVTKDSGKNVEQLSRTASVDVNIFNTHIGLMPGGGSFIFYEWKDIAKKNEFLIGNIYGGLAGSVVQLEIDLDEELPDFELPYYEQIKSEKNSDDEYTIPAKIGQTKVEINQILKDHETEIRNDMQWFYDIGLMVKYENSYIKSIHLAHFTGGKLSKDYVFGISIGDSFDECVQLWGQPKRKESPVLSCYKSFWNYQGHQIEIEFWNKDSNGTDPWFPEYKKDTIRSIDLSKQEY